MELAADCVVWGETLQRIIIMLKGCPIVVVQAKFVKLYEWL